MRAVLVGLLLLALPAGARAQGVNSNVALPVAEGEGIWRSQLRFSRASDDPTRADRGVRTWIAPQTLLVGITPRLTAFATLPMLAHQRIASDSGSTRSDPALGDLALLARYTLWWDDYAPLSTRRVAILAGAKLPTGADRFGTETFDPVLGGVATWAFDRHEIDLDALYTVSTQRNRFRQGDRLRYDLAYRYRLWPRRFGKRLLQLNGLLELNGHWSDRNEENGRRIVDSGGHVLFLAPGLQLAAKRWILEVSVQVPIAQDLHGSQVEQDFVAVLSVRVPFELPF
jgi:hypothetical protein